MIISKNARQLADFAEIQQARCDAMKSPKERKEQGHFGTPMKIAEFMAAMFAENLPNEICLLDPGAGVGTLTAAFCDQILLQSKPRLLYCELWENDPEIFPLLESTMQRCQEHLVDAGHKMTFSIRTKDFILSNRQKSFFDSGPEPKFDFVITNPPYFKLRKDSPQAQAMAHVVHGQPNIYALFMALAVDMLVENGQMVAITPRSYFNGPYFRKFRKWFFDFMAVQQIHSFQSRKDAFREDAVLQENVIVHASKSSSRPHHVVVSSSIGRDFENLDEMRFEYSHVIDNSNGDHIMRLLTKTADQQIVAALDRLTERLNTLDLAVSTGPVVSFRATDSLKHERSQSTAPLLWMHNVRPFKTQFPAKPRKPAHIVVTPASKKLLLPSQNYVLLKRFTSKEENRRLIAGIFRPTDSYSQWVGLENHLNYICQIDGELDLDMAYGIAAYLNSSIVDKYFRAISGNTQVNAAELRALPMLPRSDLERLGQEIQRDVGCAMNEIDLRIIDLVGLTKIFAEAPHEVVA